MRYKRMERQEDGEREARFSLGEWKPDVGGSPVQIRREAEKGAWIRKRR